MFPFDRFTLGEALSLVVFSFHSGLCLIEGTNERFDFRAQRAFGFRTLTSSLLAEL